MCASDTRKYRFVGTLIGLCWFIVPSLSLANWDQAQELSMRSKNVHNKSIEDNSIIMSSQQRINNAVHTLALRSVVQVLFVNTLVV
jgi:hypothetical protein